MAQISIHALRGEGDEFLDYLKQELWEYIKRDGNPKPKKNETDNTNESEVVLPEDIFNIEESE